MLDTSDTPMWQLPTLTASFLLTMIVCCIRCQAPRSQTLLSSCQDELSERTTDRWEKFVIVPSIVMHIIYELVVLGIYFSFLPLRSNCAFYFLISYLVISTFPFTLTNDNERRCHPPPPRRPKCPVRIRGLRLGLPSPCHRFRRAPTENGPKRPPQGARRRHGPLRWVRAARPVQGGERRRHEGAPVVPWRRQVCPVRCVAHG